MEYNTTRNRLILREYGRNVQKMVENLITIEDTEIRTQSAKAITNVMSQLNPNIREAGDVRHKLWDHIFIMSDFRLNVDSPFPVPSPGEIFRRPKRLKYHDRDIKFRHYGNNIELIIQKAIEYPEGPEKQALVHTIANHLKKSYLNWNRESVTDELIAQHLELLSNGQLKLSTEDKLSHTNDILARNKKKKFVKELPQGMNKNHNHGYKNGFNHNFNPRQRKDRRQKTQD
ncbi:MAG: DUF4290 domain-containing protein [Lentimicrobiaceae bacterium]|nr:DUF4290 domain-containing protein [Lentimicrobiaceae bacterium]